MKIFNTCITLYREILEIIKRMQLSSAEQDGEEGSSNCKYSS